MVNYIFDLDFTLYSHNDVDESNENSFYKSFERKPVLNTLLSKIDGNKFIFSNGNEAHVREVMAKMKIKTAFSGIAFLEEYPNAKPYADAYKYVINKFKLKKTERTYFFEDTLENLKYAKKIGWITVLISKNKRPYKYVDFIFPNIESAIASLTRQKCTLKRLMKKKKNQLAKRKKNNKSFCKGPNNKTIPIFRWEKCDKFLNNQWSKTSINIENKEQFKFDNI